MYHSNRAALQYFKYKGQAVDKMIEQLDHTASLWSDVVKQAPLTQQTIVPLVKTWSVQISEQIETYGKEMATKLKDFKKRAFWEDNLTPEEAAKAMEEAEKALADETAELAKKTQLCATFDFPHLVSIKYHGSYTAPSFLNPDSNQPTRSLYYVICVIHTLTSSLSCPLFGLVSNR